MISFRRFSGTPGFSCGSSTLKTSSFHICKTGWIIPMSWGCENSMRERLWERFFKPLSPLMSSASLGKTFLCLCWLFQMECFQHQSQMICCFPYCVKCVWKRCMAKVDSMTGLTRLMWKQLSLLGASARQFVEDQVINGCPQRLRKEILQSWRGVWEGCYNIPLSLGEIKPLR